MVVDEVGFLKRFMKTSHKGPARKDIAERINEHIYPCPITGCYLWGGYTNGVGYGQLSVGRGGNGRCGKVLVHRLTHQMVYGELADDIILRHTCDTRACVNPEHTIPGTQKQNVHDAIKRGRWARGSGFSHAKLTEGQIPAIRVAIANGANLAALARTLGVSPTALYAIKGGRSWKHV